MTMTKRENFLTALKGGMPEWIPNYSTDSQFYFPAALGLPFAELLAEKAKAAAEGDPDRIVKAKDHFGITWVLDSVSTITDPENILLENGIEEWREKYMIPDMSNYDWEASAKADCAILDPDKVIEMYMRGPFLQMVDAMGFENTLIAMAMEKEEAHAFLDAVTCFQEEIIRHILPLVPVDTFLPMDDWANSVTMFMSPEMFREMILPYEKRLIDCARSVKPDILIDYHVCGHCEAAMDDVMTLGIDAWQPAEQSNDLAAIRKKYPKLGIIGAWNNVEICSKTNITEDEVRQSVRESMDKYARNGGYIFWTAGKVGFGDEINRRLSWADDEADRYGTSFYKSR